MGWVSALAKQFAKEAPESAAMMSVKADLGQAAVGGGIGAALPADSAEERLRNIGLGAAVGVGAGRLERVLPGVQPPDVAASGFAGLRARTADLRALERAKAMEGAGINAHEIWTETGWFRDMDGQYKFEIDDSASKLKVSPEAMFAGGRFKLGDVLHHPSLTTAYPDLKDWTVSFVDMGPVTREKGELIGSLGQTYADYRRIELNRNLTPEEARSTLMHEIDHGIQSKEGFGLGDNPASARPMLDVPIIDDIRAYIDDAENTLLHEKLTPDQKTALNADIAKAYRDLDSASRFAGYLHSHGEAMARNTETRLNMSAGGRRELYPMDSLDVDPARVTVRRSLPKDRKPTFHPWLSETNGDIGHLKRYESPLELKQDQPPLLLDKLVAYHGTAHAFDKFDMSKIGAGEGNQGFGQGLYFAQREGTARWYRKTVAELDLENRAKIGGQAYDRKNPEHYAIAYYWAMRDNYKYGTLLNHGSAASYKKGWAGWAAVHSLKRDRDAILAAGDGKGADSFGVPGPGRISTRDPAEAVAYLDKAISYLEAHAGKKEGRIPKLDARPVTADDGHLYTVALDAPAEKTINYDTTFSAQSETVKAAIQAAIEAGAITGIEPEKLGRMRMPEIIRQLGKIDSPAMKILREHDVRGVRYLDQVSRSPRPGQRQTHNFVVFDDARIAIVGEDGKLKTPLAGASLLLAITGASGLGENANAQESQAGPGPAANDGSANAEPMAAAQTVEDPAASPGPSLPRGFVREQKNPTFQAFQATTLPGMETAPETVQGEETTGQVVKPSSLAVWGAAFRLENVIGSALAKEQPEYGEWEEGFNPLAPENLEGYEQYADKFIDARTATRQEQIKRQIDRELADRDAVARGGLNGVVAQLAAGTIDPTILIPVGGTVKKGESLLKIGGRFAMAGFAGASASEFALQQTQELRSKEESVLNITGGTILGGILGTGGYSLTRLATGKAVWSFDAEFKALGDRIEREMIFDPANDPVFQPEALDRQAMGAVNPNAAPQSVGAARAAEATLDDYALAPSLGTADVSAAMQLNPLLRLATSSSAKAREAAALLMENGMYLNRNKEGLASPISVEQAMTEYRGWHAAAEQAAKDALIEHRKAGGRLSGRAFHEEVGRALRRGDQHEDPYVAKAAKAYRSAIEKTKDRAIEAGLLPEDVEVTTAASYFHRMWNRRVLIRKPEQFRTMVGAWLGETFDKIRTRAAQLEAEQAQRGDYVSKLSDDFNAENLNAKSASKALREIEREIAGHDTQIGKYVARREKMSEDVLDLTDELERLGPDGDTAKQQARIKKLAERIRQVDEDIAAREKQARAARDRLPDAQAKLKDAEAYAGRLKTELDGTKAESGLSDEDMKFIQSARELAEIERIEGNLDGYREDATQHIYDTLMGYDSRTLPAGITAAARGPLKERTFNIPDLFEHEGIRAEDFLVSDAQEVMDRYMRVMAADIELTRTFGKPDMEDVFAGIKDEYEKLIDAAKDEATKKRLRNEMDNRIRDLEGVRDVIRGNFGPPTYENMYARGAAIVRHWNYATLLGGMTVSALPDVGNKVLANGFLGIARDLVLPLVADIGKVKLAAKEAEALGIAVERTLATRIASMADIGDVYGRATVFERALGAMTNHFTRWTGMRLWNDVMKQADYVIASNRAIRAMDRPGKAGAPVKTWLANLGIGEADYPRIMTQIRKYGTTSGAMRLANPEQWDDPVARRIWTGAMGKNANIQTVTPGAGDKLLMMNTELGKTIGQFKTFTFAANQRVTIRGAQQARMGHARVASALVTYVSLGMLVYYLKQVGSGRTPSEDPVTWVREGVDRSGIISVAMEGFNTAEKLTGQTFVGSSPASRYATRGPFASLLGPSVGRGEDVAMFLKNAFDGKLQDRDIHALRKMLPYNNIFWLRKIFDEAEIATVAATGAEETSLSDRRESVFN